MSQRPLRVLDVATLVSPDGAYGGPIRVAVNQCTALRDSGHVAELAAAARGYEVLPATLSGVPAHLYPARTLLPGLGFAGIGAPAMVPWFMRRRHDYDVVHVHLARDLVTLPLARLSISLGIPTVVQPHGMIDRSANSLAWPLDAALTRPTLRRASRVMFLTDRERDDLRLVAGDSLQLEHLRNGIAKPDGFTGRPHRSDNASGTDVLFLARLHPRKRASTFVEAAIALLDAGSSASFSIVGPDEGDGARVRQLIASSGHGDRIRCEGALDPEATRERMARADVYVLPSIDEPFPMSVLEAMSESLPVVLTDSCGLAPLVARTGSGIVVDDSVSRLVDAVGLLVDDTDLRMRLSANAFHTVTTQLSMDAVGDQLVETYRSVISGR